ncbi:MAG: cholesterol oxidase [Verrucomicrobiales bacterium]|jgi:cholesterol oxidase
MSKSLANHPDELKSDYQTVVIGSGYGGAITAARLASKGQPVCILERGKEWHPGDFPDQMDDMAMNLRGPMNKLGLVELYMCKDIDVLKGCGLGGGSLVNLNVAFRPDQDYFDSDDWPKAIRALADSGKIWNYYNKAEGVLKPNHHPRFNELTKVQMMKKRVEQLEDAKFGPANITVNFDIDGKNKYGVNQKPCIDCGDCFPGCNVGAKNTVAMNYLPLAKSCGAEIFTQMDVSHIAKDGDGWIIYFRRYNHNAVPEAGMKSIRASKVVLAAGSPGSVEILLRSAAHGLKLADALGKGFSGNGDWIGLCYNSDHRTNVMGFGNHLDSKRAEVRPGTTIASAIQYNRSKPFSERITVEDFTVLPSAMVDMFRQSLPMLAMTGKKAPPGSSNETGKAQRVAKDMMGWNADGALNHSMVYLVMAADDAGGTVYLNGMGKIKIKWPSLREDPIWPKIEKEIQAHAAALGGTFVQLDRPNPFASNGKNLITAHPLGGNCMADDPDGGVVDADGRVFHGDGGTHDGLYVADGSILPRSVGVNPFLTISAFSERIAERMVA